MASSTKTRPKLLPLLACLLALRPAALAATPQVGLTAGASEACSGVRGDEGSCQRYARVGLNLDIGHFQPRSQEKYRDRSWEITGKGIDAGQDVVKDSPRAAVEGTFRDPRALAMAPIVIPLAIVIISLFGVIIMGVSLLLGGAAIAMSTLFGAENVLGLYVIEDRGERDGDPVWLRHVGLQFASFPVEDVWLRFHFAGGVVKTDDSLLDGYSFKSGLGVAPPPDRSGPLLVGEVERLSLTDAEGDKKESRQLALSAGFALSF